MCCRDFTMRTRLLIFVASLVLFGLRIAPARERNDPPATSTTTTSDEERNPVAVPEPSALAMRYYWTGNWLWAFDQIWEVAIPVLLLFTGAAARFRDLAMRFGRKSFVAVGIFVVLYLATGFVLVLPLLYYQGFVRQHAYGLSRQTFSRWFGHELKWLMVSAMGGALFAWIPLRIDRATPETMVARPHAALGALPILRAADHADLDRSDVQQTWSVEGPVPRNEDPRSRPSGWDRMRPDLRGREERGYEGSQRQGHRLPRHKADPDLGHADR